MKVAVLFACLAFAASSQRYPSGGYQGSFPGRGRPIVFPGVGVGGPGQFPRPQRPIHPQQPGVGGGIGGHGSLTPIGHGGEPLYQGACGRYDNLIHESFGGHNYHLSWCRDGGQRYTWQHARDYCTGLGSGWYPVAIESQAEDSFIVGLVQSHRSPWIWTGGNRLNTKGVYNWEWLDGTPLGYTNWGQTGSSNEPQPDNAENNNEQCLALLNQFYPGDFITWHDIGCHHDKPVICEQSRNAPVQRPQYG